MTPRDQKKERRPSAPARLRVMNPHAAGIDVHANVHWVAVPAADAPAPPPDHPPNLPPHVRSFGTCTADLMALADWLKICRVRTVVMESTGIYWIPLFELLESRGFQVLLVEPRQSRHAPGRPKSDVLDCQWLQRLHSYGLLSGSFRPAEQIVVLRSYRYGFRFEASPSKGFDLRRPILRPDGSTELVDIRTLSFVRFDGNEAHDHLFGVNLGGKPGDFFASGVDGVVPGNGDPFLVQNAKIWNTHWAFAPHTRYAITNRTQEDDIKHEEGAAWPRQPESEGQRRLCGRVRRTRRATQLRVSRPEGRRTVDNSGAFVFRRSGAGIRGVRGWKGHGEPVPPLSTY